MATPANKAFLIIAGFCFAAAPALADHKNGKKHYYNEPYYNELSRSDFIALNAGNAPQANITIEADEIWPAYVNDTHFHTEGVVGEKIINEFRKRRASPPAQPAGPTITINAGGPPATP